VKAFGSTLVVLLLLSGAGLMAYARWTGALEAADAALADGRFEDAVVGYQAAEARFDALPATKQIVAIEYNHAVGNHLLALYRLKRYDEVIDVALKAPPAASPNFWAACALFQKATVEEAPEARLGWLTRAEEEFRKAIEAAPSDWDTKFDFELTTRLATELRKQPNTPPKQLMQLLRPPTAGAKPPRRTG
jgi:tetratricopeptide (TPR) repeat protein